MTTETVSRTHFTASVAYLLTETFAGSPEGQGSAYLDRGVGLFDTLATVTAAQASTDFHGTTIAAQTEHAKFYLDRLCEFIGGRSEKVNWEDSWLIETVNDNEWSALQTTVRRSYEETLQCIATQPFQEERQVGLAMGLIAHTAYHLGAIRQKVAVLRSA